MYLNEVREAFRTITTFVVIAILVLTGLFITVAVASQFYKAIVWVLGV